MEKHSKRSAYSFAQLAQQKALNAAARKAQAAIDSANSALSIIKCAQQQKGKDCAELAIKAQFCASCSSKLMQRSSSYLLLAADTKQLANIADVCNS